MKSAFRTVLIALALAFAPFTPVLSATVVQAIGTVQPDAGTTISESFSTLPSATHQVIAIFAGPIQNGSGAVSIADNQGNTYKLMSGFWGDSANQDTTVQVWEATSIGTPSGTFTVTATFPSNGHTQLSIIEATGAQYVDSAGYGVSLDGAAASFTATNLYQDAGATDLVVSAAQISGSATTLAGPGSGWTYPIASGTASSGMGYRVNSSILTDSILWTPSASDEGTSVIVSFGASNPGVPYPVQTAVLTGKSGTTIGQTLYSVNAGDTLLAEVGAGVTAAPTVSDGTGYTQDVWEQQSTNSGAGSFSLWNASAGTHAIVATLGSSANAGIVVMEVANLPTSDSFDTSGVASGSSTGPVTATTGALASRTDFVVANAVVNNYTSIPSSPSGWLPTALGAGGGIPNSGISILVPGATTALSPSYGMLGSSQSWALAVAAYKPTTSSIGAGVTAYVPGTRFSQWIPYSASASLPRFPGGLYRIECNSSGGAVTVTLPTAVSNFSAYELVKVDSSGNACSFATTSSQTINGTTPTTITSQWGKQAVASDNINWVEQ